MPELFTLAPIARLDVGSLNAHIRELNARLRRISEMLDRAPRSLLLKGNLDAGGFRLTNLGTAQSDDDALPLGQLQGELDELERRLREDLTSEAEDGGDSTDDDTSDGRGDDDDNTTSQLEEAIPTAAPPDVATTGTVGTTTDPIKFALSDHTHGGIRAVRKNSTGSEFTRRRVNLIEGSNVTLTVADDVGDDEVDVTIAAASSGSAGWQRLFLVMGA